MSKDVELESVNLTSGVNEKGAGFITVSAMGVDRRTMLVGQIDPTTARGMALQWLEVAEAADQDAAVMRAIRKLGLPDQMAAVIVTELRESRDGQ